MFYVSLGESRRTLREEPLANPYIYIYIYIYIYKRKGRIIHHLSQI
jgi:hypothetical protein